ncbi:cytochrome c oxidase assembly protein COX16 [Halomarina pelagica]|uniref:cytochrome c oxidase assembly protein COX16 n=1 Tax=Halomarina pelagica TaxID=2961599 RepID=UPI0020C55FE2|nr:cytochrome c oxidase assembly protein COX16 [Halomarina sp. BND7]
MSLRTLLAQSYADQWMSGKFWDAATGPYIDTLGLPLFALIVFGSVGLSYYAYSGKAIIPIVMIVLVGGFTIAAAPPTVGSLLVVLLMLVVTGFGYMLIIRARDGV